ncbi:MAG: glycosyl-4,4'-diaponeurosporenoate acyltransferase [Chitinivibrionales bacterium]|nr:glycosyl-4,4'-diaponeurosporenoate acyltransferase [Chitinivibrionales bacterium]MBD3356446.1 glycosyl-4,4'-diaponeurosporenoate acyltransferase [Chitinivibrionales bacterium]
MKRSPRSTVLLIIVNASTWLAIHVFFAWGLTRLPLRLFDPAGFVCRPRRWERNGEWYERVLRVKRWKNLLPDGALLFAGGFPKGKISGRDPVYLRRFIGETCRGESVHWLVIAASPLFFLWNPLSGGLINILYACMANMPCIASLRYNRLHLLKILTRYAERPEGKNSYGN